MIEATTATQQGIFEKKLANAKDDESKAANQVSLQKNLDQIAADDLPIEIVTPMEVIHEIAQFENTIFDRERQEILTERGYTSWETVPEEERSAIQEETEQKLDTTLRNIGRNYMRGRIYPGKLGEYFRNKATQVIDQYRDDLPPLLREINE